MDTFEKIFNFRVRIRNRRMIVSIITAILVGYIAYKFFECDKKEVIAISSVTLLAMSMLYHSANLQKLELDKKMAAMNAITEWYKDFSEKSRALRECRHEFTARKLGGGKNGTIININEMIESEKDSQNVLYVKSLIPILNFFEKLSIGIEANALDEGIIKDYFSDLFISYHDTFLPVILDRRSKAKGLPSAFENYEEVVLKWEKEREKPSGKRKKS